LEVTPENSIEAVELVLTSEVAILPMRAWAAAIFKNGS
jgi:hypothetical protein